MNEDLTNSHGLTIYWSRVQRRHVLEACRKYDSREELPSASPRSTFLKVDGRTYPAKFVLGLAYKLATGMELTPDDFSGSDYSARRLRCLGFDVDHSGKAL